MSFKMKLGGYTFEWNPDRVSLPHEKKTVATVETYSGSAIFQWESFLEGTEVELWWDFMSEAQYNALRARYLSLNSWRWVAEVHQAFTAYATNLDGSYVQTGLHELPYRTDVKMKLNLREAVSASTTTI